MLCLFPTSLFFIGGNMSNIISVKKIGDYSLNPQQKIEQHSLNQTLISNNGFFPDISLDEVRNAMRIDGTVTNDRLQFAVIEAMASVNQDLSQFKKNAKSYRTLADYPTEQINGEHLLILRYKRAVYCLAMANLNERYRSYDTTKDGEDNAEKIEQTIDDLRRDARFAIRDIQRLSRITVGLI